MKKSLLIALFGMPLMSCGVSAPMSDEWEARARVARQMDVGEPAPDWLADSETYAIAYRPDEWDALAQSRVAFVTHCPINREYFQRCHALGIRCFPYVTFYHGDAASTYEGVNLKDHPEFIDVDAQGNPIRSRFWASEDMKNMYATCPNVREFQDAMVAWVRKIMELGADGVFVDCLGACAPCFGPRFRKHDHIGEDQNHAFALLLQRIRALIKQYRPDGALLGNSAWPSSLPAEFWKYLDADMLESYICSWASKDRWFDWKTRWNKAGKELQPYIAAGKQVQALSYLGHTRLGVREDAFFCYASARLAGFAWNGGLPLSDPDTAVLYRLRLGRALTGELEENGAHFRAFERGLVAVNPEKDKPAGISLPPAIAGTRLLDLSRGTANAWQPCTPGGYRLDRGSTRSGSSSIVCSNATPGMGGGATQGIALNQTGPVSIIVSGWSKAEEVSGAKDGNYSLYVDITYDDGTKLYGQTAPFNVGTHDWQQESVTIVPRKPIKVLQLSALFRHKTGTVWFDDVSLAETTEGAPENRGTERAANGGFEERGQEGQMIDVGATRTLDIPPYSGRVYLFASGTNDELSAKGFQLTVATSPPLAEVHFRVDDLDCWTHGGRWTTDYVRDADFGRFHVSFDKPGRHAIELVDIVPHELQTPAGYVGGQRLGASMDPANPTQPSDGRKYRFRRWEGTGAGTKIELDVSGDTTLTASFDAEGPPK